ncbi:YezD family protein [Nitrosovibrio sp. Nv17]|uniref:YezD family protein n=1 Tax=Nitrosovibrio sp. Nv17 TaxID=1855339 RepID=UPI000908D620|nr:YezD family protein [Nitrosovibrio sp. Nv17]SFW10863.1 hypothetical protein SAMN05216414_101143 [Nitrosovibrio sp. Nv17]
MTAPIANSDDAAATGNDTTGHLPPEIGQQILRAIAAVQYGSVEVLIHDGRVVQIESRRKIRLSHDDASRRR